MEHSKLLWKKKHHKILDFHGRLIADVRGACGFGEDEDNAKFIVTACNEHNTLERKAELFDELVVAYRVKFAINDSPVSMMVLIDEFAAKAKELK